jgi:hypothetical protein
MALAEIGFDPVFQCADDACGGTNLACAIEQFPLPVMIVDPFNYHYQGARTTTDAGEVYAAQTQTDLVETGRVALLATVTESIAFGQQAGHGCWSRPSSQTGRSYSVPRKLKKSPEQQMLQNVQTPALKILITSKNL